MAIRASDGAKNYGDMETKNAKTKREWNPPSPRHFSLGPHAFPPKMWNNVKILKWWWGWHLAFFFTPCIIFTSVLKIRQIRWCNGDYDGNNADDDDRDNVDDDHDDDGRLPLVLSSFLPSSPITASQSPIGWTSTFIYDILQLHNHSQNLNIHAISPF